MLCAFTTAANNRPIKQTDTQHLLYHSCALLVDLDRALLTGAAYCVGRAFYYTLHPYHLVLVGLVTVPNYAEIAYMFMLVAHWAIY